MKKAFLLLAVVTSLAPAALAGRNFSGVWSLSRQSLLASIDTVYSGAALITIRMAANKMTVISETPRIFEEYVIDGEDHPIATRLGSMTYATSWEGDTLVITRTPAKDSRMKAQTLRFSISSNMRYLQITCTLAGDKDPQDVLSWGAILDTHLLWQSWRNPGHPLFSRKWTPTFLRNTDTHFTGESWGILVGDSGHPLSFPNFLRIFSWHFSRVDS